MTLDVAKAAQIMREAGFDAHIIGRVSVGAFSPGNELLLATQYRTDAMPAVSSSGYGTSAELRLRAARLLALADVCERIDAECRGAPAPEPQCARDVTVTWAPGPGAPLGPRGVVPGDPSTYPAEGEPVAPHDTEGRP